MRENSNLKKTIIEIETPDVIKQFIKVPKEVILNKTLPEHRISVFLYLICNKTYWNSMVHYSPIYMIEWNGYKANWRSDVKKNIYTKFRDCMNWFNENEYISNFDIEKFKPSSFQSVILNEEKYISENNFGIIYDFEIEIINSYISDYKPLNRSVLLLLLAYIRIFTWIRHTDVTGHSKKSKMNKPEIFFSQFTTIATYIGLTPNMVSRATKVLEQLGLIVTHRMPSYVNAKGKWRTDDIIYVCPYKYLFENNQITKCTKEEYDCEEELVNGIMYLRENKSEDKKFYQN